MKVQLVYTLLDSPRYMNYSKHLILNHFGHVGNVVDLHRLPIIVPGAMVTALLCM